MSMKTQNSFFRHSSRSGRAPVSPLWMGESGETAKKIPLASGTSAHRRAMIFHFSMPKTAKNAVDSSTTAIWPQQ